MASCSALLAMKYSNTAKIFFVTPILFFSVFSRLGFSWLFFAKAVHPPALFSVLTEKKAKRLASCSFACSASRHSNLAQSDIGAGFQGGFLSGRVSRQSFCSVAWIASANFSGATLG